MSHSFHIHFFTRLLIRVDRSKLKERIDNGLLFSAAINTQGKMDKLLNKTVGKNVFAAQLNKGIFIVVCVAERSLTTVSTFFNCSKSVKIC